MLLAVYINVIEVEAATTTVDLTGLATGAEVSHDCNKYIATKYDTVQHWQECSICNKVYGAVSNHSYTTTGTAGCANAYGYQYNTCSCGYSYQLPKTPHTDPGTWYPCGDRNQHYRRCTTCNQWTISEYCKNSSGQEIGCRTGIEGDCVYCGAHRYGYKHGLISSIATSSVAEGYTITNTGYLGCADNCGINFGDYTITSVRQNDTYVKYSMNLTCSLSLPSLTLNAGSCAGITNYGTQIGLTSYYQSGNNISAEGWCSHSKDVLASGAYELHFGSSLIQSTSFVGDTTIMHLSGAMRADQTAPVCSTANISYKNYVSGYATKAVVTGSYVDNYSNTVSVRILDSNQTTVLSNWGSAVASGTTFTRDIDIVSEITGSKTIYIQGKDESNNLSQLTPITLSNLDSKPPVLTSGLTTATGWTKNKAYRVVGTDGGSGTVNIGFNTTNDYKLADVSGSSYYRDYNLVGDVYGSVKVAVYLKDKVGNTTTKFLTVYNLDNTAPTITNIAVNNATVGSTVLTVIAHDKHATLGTGSGIAGCAITNTNSAPASTAYQISNVFNITKSGTYYIWVKDAVGNVTSKSVNALVRRSITINSGNGLLSNGTNSAIYNNLPNSVITLPNPTLAGYTFYKWNINSGAEGTIKYTTEKSTFTVGDTNAVLTAVYAKNLKLTFDLNNGTGKKIVLEGADFTSTDGYTFGIYNNMTQAKLDVCSKQINQINAYGTYNANGENKLYTKTSSDGTIYRFLGWSLNPNATKPDNDFDVFNSGRKIKYTIQNDTILYAVWEPVLQTNFEIDRTLGSLTFSDGSLPDNDRSGLESSDGEQTIELLLRPGEQAMYQVDASGSNNLTFKIAFDSRITDIYTKGDSNSIWYDNLNPSTSEDLTAEQPHGLDRQITGKKNFIRKFFIPQYLGTDRSYDTSNPNKTAVPVNKYSAMAVISQPSYFYNKIHGKDEQIIVNIDIYISPNNSPDYSNEDDGGAPTILDDLRTKLKIRLQ